jgi:NAD(P)H-hydrate epimerase
MNFSKLKSLPISLHDQRHLDKLSEKLDHATVIVDAMLGVGIAGELRPPYDDIVTRINRLDNKLIVSVDIPTGMGTSNAVHPNATITFHDKKPNMNETNCGDLIIADIKIPEKAQTHVGPGELSVYYPRSKKESHKGQNGRVLVVGGGPFTGAPALSSLAALRTGADLAFVATPKNVAQIIASYSPNLIVHPLESDNFLSENDVSSIISYVNQVDSVLIGPGLGDNPKTNAAVRSIIKEAVSSSKKMVIDADAIKPLFNHHDLLKSSEIVITPHAQEFTKLTGETLHPELTKKQKQVQNWAKKLNVSLFLKGSTDILSDGDSLRLNTVHNPAMTVGGTGDVLAGIIVALLSKNVPAMTAMRIAAFLNGEAGNKTFKNLSYGLLSTDIVDKIPLVLNEYVH